MVEERGRARAESLSDWLRKFRAAVGEVKGCTYLCEVLERDGADVRVVSVNSALSSNTAAQVTINTLCTFLLIYDNT